MSGRGKGGKGLGMGGAKRTPDADEIGRKMLYDVVVLKVAFVSGSPLGKLYEVSQSSANALK